MKFTSKTTKNTRHKAWKLNSKTSSCLSVLRGNNSEIFIEAKASTPK